MYWPNNSALHICINSSVWSTWANGGSSFSKQNKKLFKGRVGNVMF